MHIQQALNAAKEKNITGKNVISFLLQYIAWHSEGESLEVNIAFIKYNAKVKAEVALEYSIHHHHE